MRKSAVTNKTCRVYRHLLQIETAFRKGKEAMPTKTPEVPLCPDELYILRLQMMQTYIPCLFNMLLNSIFRDHLGRRGVVPIGSSQMVTGRHRLLV